MKPYYRKPEVVINKVPGMDKWMITTYGRHTQTWTDPYHGWDTCPGSLYQHYPTEEDAQVVALWWGYRITDEQTRRRRALGNWAHVLSVAVTFGILMSMAMMIY